MATLAIVQYKILGIVELAEGNGSNSDSTRISNVLQETLLMEIQ